MPRARPTRIPCNCFDCRVLDVPVQRQADIPAWKASALQEPPPKCLIFLLPENGTPSQCARPFAHLDALVAEGCSGLLARRGVFEEVDDSPINSRQVLAEFLGLHQGPSGKATSAASQAQQLQAKRYKGLAAGIASCCGAAVSVAQQAGVAHVSSLFSKDAAQSQKALLEAGQAADQILAALGLKRCLAAKAAALRANASALFEDNDDEDDLDMLFVDASSASTDSSAAEQDTAFAWVDAVVGHLCRDEDVKDSIFMVVLMAVEKPLRSPERVGGAELPPGMQRPKQSYEYVGVEEVRVQRNACVVMAQRLKGVARRDSAKVFSYEEVSKWGAAGQILLERLLPELAFKLGRASKYGA